MAGQAQPALPASSTFCQKEKQVHGDRAAERGHLLLATSCLPLTPRRHPTPPLTFPSLPGSPAPSSAPSLAPERSSSPPPAVAASTANPSPRSCFQKNRRDAPVLPAEPREPGSSASPPCHRLQPRVPPRSPATVRHPRCFPEPDELRLDSAVSTSSLPLSSLP